MGSHHAIAILLFLLPFVLAACSRIMPASLVNAQTPDVVPAVEEWGVQSF